VASHTARWDAELYARNAGFVAELGMPVVKWLAPRAGERVLDLGCGDGTLSLELVALGCEVVGVDSSPEMIAAARRAGLNAQVMDGRKLAFDDAFDAVFSNAALHWMTSPEAVIDGVWRALRPGGRFVGEFGGHGNVAAIVTALEEGLAARGMRVVTPWFFPRPDEYRALLEARGFSVSAMRHVPRPTALPGSVEAWLETFARPYIDRLPADARRAFVAEVVETLRPVLCDSRGVWTADYVRLRFSATKPGPPG